MVTLYDHSNIDTLPWPDNFDGQYAKSYLYPLIKNGPMHYIDNVKTNLQALTIDDLVLPITINNQEYENSYVCSPYGQYVSYALGEIFHLKNPAVKVFLKTAVLGLGGVLKLGQINKVVIVNNWLLPTNLYPHITPQQVERITQFLTNKFPNHLIMWRSINEKLHHNILSTLQKIGYRSILGRKVYMFNSKNKSSFKKRNIEIDEKLFATGEYEAITLTESINIEQVRSLYLQLYCDKHSQMNPKFNCHFFSLAIQEKLLHMKVLRKAGDYYGILGYFYRNGVLTTPCIGYNTSVDQKEGLYRRLSCLLLREAKELQMELHGSSGAGSFKTKRGHVPQIEYNLFFCRHLQVHRRVILWLFNTLSKKIGVPLMQKYW